MGVLQSLFEKEKKAHSLGICIPEAGKRKAMQEQLKRRKMVRDEIESVEGAAAKGAFEVTGLFHVHDCLMLQGSVLEGAISKKSSAVFKGIRLKVADVQTSGKVKSALAEGEQGAVFVKTEKGRYPIIRIGDVIEF